MIRIGHGYDSHRYEDGDYIVIGGVKIMSKRSIVAHSDGDILIHAICDALLGASGNGDMGKYYDNTEKYKNMDIPRPPHWGGYMLKPRLIEFWQGRPSRLHDRIVFEMDGNGDWKVYRKNP